MALASMKIINNSHADVVQKTVVAILFELNQGGELIKSSVLVNKILIDNFF